MLAPATLQQSVLRRTDRNRTDFVGYPPSFDAAAVSWAAIATEYFGAAINPPLIAGRAAGEAAFIATLLPQLAISTPDNVQVLANAFRDYAVAASVAAAASVPGSVAVPPSSALAFTLPLTNDATSAAVHIATQVDTWARTGIWTPNAAATPAVPWS